MAVLGAGGAIGGHLVARLLADGQEVVGADVKPLADWWQLHPEAVNVGSADLADAEIAGWVLRRIPGVTEVYDLAENMGGISWITSERVACAESIQIGITCLRAAAKAGIERFFFASSACVYNMDLQTEPQVAALSEDMAWPAKAEDGYGFCKLYMEELCRHYREDGRLDTRVARYHNVFGPYSSWTGGKEKAPAAICRKVAGALSRGEHEIEVWGDGLQTRSFLYVDDCVEGTLRLMASDYPHPVNIGSDRLVTINDLVTMVEHIAGWHVTRRYNLAAPQGVRGRNSDNTLCRQVLGWEPRVSLEEGLSYLYEWVLGEVQR